MSKDKEIITINETVGTVSTPLDLNRADASLEAVWRLAKVYSMAGFWQDIRDPAKAAVKIMLGRELGLSPAQAINGTYLTKQGTLALSARTLAALIKASGKYDYRVLEKSPTICRVQILQQGRPIGTETYTIEEAQQAGLTGRDNWRK